MEKQYRGIASRQVCDKKFFEAASFVSSIRPRSCPPRENRRSYRYLIWSLPSPSTHLLYSRCPLTRARLCSPFIRVSHRGDAIIPPPPRSKYPTRAGHRIFLSSDKMNNFVRRISWTIIVRFAAHVYFEKISSRCSPGGLEKYLFCLKKKKKKREEEREERV